MTNSRFGPEFGLLVKRRRAERGLSQDQLAAIIWPEVAGPKDHPNKSQLSRLETGKVPNPQEKTILALCEALGIREDEVNALRLGPAPSSSDLDSVASFLAKMKERSKADLEDLARHYGEDAPQDRSREWLLTFLRDKADTIARLAKRIKDLEGFSPGIDNIRTEARQAILDGRLDVARRLLDGARDVRQPELRRAVEANATLMELSAEIDLVEGKADRAFTLFSAAADSFAGIDPVEVAQRRRRYSIRLKDYAEKFDEMAFSCAIRLLNRLISDLSKDDSSQLWYASHNSLGIVCTMLGQRAQGQERTDLLLKALEAHQVCIQDLERSEHPEEWGIGLHNTAITLAISAEGYQGSDSIDLLLSAERLLDAAFEVRTKQDSPFYWGCSMQTLGNILFRIGEQLSGQSGMDFLERAESTLEETFDVFISLNVPIHWAKSKLNLATVLMEQGSRTAGLPGYLVFKRAVAAFDDAQTVFTRSDHPMYWATIKQSLAICYRAWSQHAVCSNPSVLLGKALEHVEAALTVYDANHLTYYHAKAARMRVDIQADLAATG